MKKIERKVNESFNNVTPDTLNSIRSDCPTRTPSTVATRSKNTTWGWKIATCALALLLVVTVVLSGVFFGKTGKISAVASTVTLDVNPSVEIQLNSSRRVVRVNALNADGKRIIGNMDFEGAQLEVTVNALIGSMIRNKFLDESSNSVLVSVSADASEYDALVGIVSEEISMRLSEATVDASVVSQWLRDTDSANQLATEYGISVGKAQLINKIMQSAPDKYTVEQLVKLKINELNLIAEGLDISDDVLTQQGTASDGKYIGRDKAIAIALERVNASLTAQDVNVKCKMDFDDGVMVYEVEFVYDGWKYEIEVDATNEAGNIVGFEREVSGRQPAGTDLTEEEIKALAFDIANVPEEERASISVSIERDRDDGRTEYELKFVYGDVRYKFEIDQYGNILSVKKEQFLGDTPVGQLTNEQIKQAVLAKVQSKFPTITLDGTREWEIELEFGQTYEIEFSWGRYEFECRMNVQSGEITFEYELDD